MNALASDARESKDLSSRLASAVSRTTHADAAVAERTALAERLSAARERGETIAIDTAQDPHHLAMFLRFAEQYGGNSASALALFEAELARQGLPPNRTFSDETALPSSFGDIRRLHEAGAADPMLAADIDAQASTNRGKVFARATPVPFTASSTTPSLIRSEVDARTETVSAPDGTLQSRKSLLKQAGYQAAKDASASVDNATEIVTDLFRKKK